MQLLSNMTAFNSGLSANDQVTRELTRVASKKPSSKKVTIAAPLTDKVHFSKQEAVFSFNTLGLVNTSKNQLSLYRIRARIGDQQWQFDTVDWHQSSNKVFRVCSGNIDVASANLGPNACIVYRIDRFNCETCECESDYAFAVHPLVQQTSRQKVKVAFG